MLTGQSSQLAHDIQNLSIIALSLAALPLTTSVLALTYAYQLLFSFLLKNVPEFETTVNRHNAARSPLRTSSSRRRGPRKTVLVTGVGMTKGLTLARLFYLAGHDVIGADFEPGGHALVCGRVSKCLKRFYRLLPPSPPIGKENSGSDAYVSSLVDIIRKEKLDLWVSCSGVASAVEDGIACEALRKETPWCKAVQFDTETTKILHEKGTFIETVRKFSLIVPETVEVRSQKEALDVVLKDSSNDHINSQDDGKISAQTRKYILKTIGVDDSVRGDMTLLPLSTAQATESHISKLKITSSTPWIVQQFIDGLEFCTHTIVVRGQVHAFIACPSAELLMHYSALPIESALSRAMLKFTQTFAQKFASDIADEGREFTGHLSFDFLVGYADLNEVDADKIKLYPIECNPRAHTAVALFNGTEKGMVDAYLSIFEDGDKEKAKVNGSSVVAGKRQMKIVTPKNMSAKYYWIGHDITTLLVLPLLNLVLLRTSLHEVIKGIDELLDHLLTWRDGTYEAWDPLPWWWLYHVYWPGRCWNMLVTRRKWSRINVSTGKMFEC